MGYLILSILMGVLGIVIIVVMFIKDEDRKWLISLIGLFLIVFSIFCTLDAIKLMKYGKYSELVKEYDMEYNDNTYTKGNLTFEYNFDENHFKNTYHIHDQKDFNVNYQVITSKMFFPLSEDVIPLIINNLIENAEHYNKDSKMTIINNHFLVEIVYHYNNQSLDYYFTEILEYRYEEEYDYNTEQKERVKVYNPEYKTKYIKPELHISHINDDYQEFDSKLLNYLFGYNYNSFIKNKNANYVEYKKLY